MKLETPPRETLDDEREPLESEAHLIDVSSHRRKHVADVLEADFETQAITHCCKFGYIFRYKRKSAKDGCGVQPTFLVLWSEDLEEFYAATYPDFDLERLIKGR